MAVMNVTYLSYSLQRYVDFKVVLPLEDTKTMDPNPQSKPDLYPTLYLLHGFTGSNGDWLYGSRIYKLARDLNIAIVMPSGENSFYVDHEDTGVCYGTFVGKELVEATRKMFPLSCKKEDTCIAGLSMGGFGSLLVGSRFAETFGAIISLSGGFLLEDLLSKDQPEYVLGRPYPFYESIFGKLDEVIGSDKDPRATAIQAWKQGILPPVYLACGTEDYVYPTNVRMKNALRDAGIPVCWKEAPGEHEWTFWDPYIEDAIHWWLHG